MTPIKFGILMIEYQTIDVAGPLDILSACSKQLMIGLEPYLGPAHAGINERAIDIEFYHINETMDPVVMTANTTMLPTKTCDLCPPLDYLLVGGPDPSTFTLSPRFATFLRAHIASAGTLFTTCTGAYAVASSGILDGKRATANHMLLDTFPALFPAVHWTKEAQWVVDGNVWTSGGAYAGMDMMAHWVIENYGIELAKIGLATLDFQPRGVDRKILAEFQ